MTLYIIASVVLAYFSMKLTKVTFVHMLRSHFENNDVQESNYQVEQKCNTFWVWEYIVILPILTAAVFYVLKTVGF